MILIVAVLRLILLDYFLIWHDVLILMTLILESDQLIEDFEEGRSNGGPDIKREMCNTIRRSGCS